MKKAFLLFLLFPLASGGMPAFSAEGDDDASASLDKIVVTARRSWTPLSGVSESMEVVCEPEIEQAPARRLPDILQAIPGVDIDPRPSPGEPTTLSIQGSDSRQVRVMIDGIPLNAQSSGQVNPSAFPFENLSRVEVIKGPASSAWGGSLGGVVNMITKDTGDSPVPCGSVTSSIAGYETLNEWFELYGKSCGIGYYLMGDYRESGGKGPRADTLEHKWFNKFTYKVPDGPDLLFSFGYGDGDIDSKFPDGMWLAQPYRNRYGKVSLEDEFLGADYKIELKHFRQEVNSRWYGDTADDVPLFTTELRDRLYQLSLLASRRVRTADTLVAGLDLDYAVVKTDKYLTRAKSLSAAAPFFNYTLSAGQWDYIFGGRFDDNSEFGSDFSPSLGTVYHFRDPWITVARARVSRAFSPPPLLWKYNDDPLMGTAPNPDIEAEHGVVYEFEAETSPLRRLRLKLSLYRADIKDALAQEEISPGLSRMSNFEKFRRQGGQLEARWKLNSRLGLRFAALFNDIENRITGQTVRDSGRSRHGFQLGADYITEYGFSFSVLGYYTRWNQPASARSNDRKFIADMKARQKLGKNLEVFLSVYNVTNSSYWADYFYPLRKRHYEGGLTFSW